MVGVCLFADQSSIQSHVDLGIHLEINGCRASSERLNGYHKVGRGTDVRRRRFEKV